MTKSVSLVVGGLLALCRPAAAQPTQPIYLQYDGFVRNANGTLTVSFGYYNMNNVDVTVPPGEANVFAPAPADRNQPITFVKGRHRFACSMVVDTTFDGKLQWTVKFAGRTETTTAKALNPLYELELNSQKKANAGLDVEHAPKNVCVNRPPTPEIVNPFGGPDASTKLAAKVDQELAINAKSPRRGRRSAGLAPLPSQMPRPPRRAPNSAPLAPTRSSSPPPTAKRARP